MKSYILIMIFLLAYAGVHAQITLTGSDNLNIGDTYRYDIYDAIENIDPGPSGGGLTWDFSNISGTYISGKPVECVNPTGTPFADSSAVQQANLCTKTADSIDGPYVYYHLDNTGQTLLGNGHYESENVSFANYYDDLTGMEFPFTYGDTYSDSYDVKIYNVTAGGYIMRDSGSVYTEADAYGSLSTPAETYNNVLRIRTITTSYTWLNFGGEWTFTGMNSTINYNWYAVGIKVPIMTITEFVGFTGYSAQYLVENNFPVGMEEIEELDFVVFPNPASDYILFRCEQDILQCKIYSLDGRILEDTKLSSGSKLYRTQVSQYPPGIYILEARLKVGGIARECFVKR